MPRRLAEILKVAAVAAISGTKIESPLLAFDLGEASAYIQAAINTRN